jgi:hypothetical protein
MYEGTQSLTDVELDRQRFPIPTKSCIKNKSLCIYDSYSDNIPAVG